MTWTPSRTSPAESASCPAPTASGVTPTSFPPNTTPLVDINAGFTPLIRSRGLAERLGLEELWIKNDSVNPSYSFKDRVVAVAAAKALGVRLRDAGLRLHGEPRLCGRSSRGAGRDDGLRLHPLRPGGGQGAGRGHLQPHHGRRRRQLRRRQPPLQRTGRSVPLGVRQHQRPPLLRRRQQDARLRGRGAAGLARSRARHRTVCIRRDVHQDLPGAEGVRADRHHRAGGDAYALRAGAGAARPSPRPTRRGASSSVL